jgi:peptidoglycan/xylan/chitin deacetylase (PgdA/CDA1 family)
MQRMKLGLRARAARALDAVGALRAVLDLRTRTGTPWLTALTYHRVSDVDEALFDRGVVDATPDDLDAHLAAASRWFTFVGIDELAAFVAGRPLPKSPLLVTFDDGYRECLDVALPVLQRHGVRATFFVPTTYVEERRVFWWDRLAYLVRRSARATLRLEYPAPRTIALEGDREAAVRALLAVVKGAFALDLERFLREVGEAADVAWTRETERAIADRLVLDWDGVRALARGGQDVESHTRSHRVLDTVPDAELDAELAGSRADLARALGAPPRSIAYPVGVPVPLRVRRAVARAGYTLGFTNTGGVTSRARFDRLAIRRVPMDRPVSPERLRALLAVPALA